MAGALLAYPDCKSLSHFFEFQSQFPMCEPCVMPQPKPEEFSHVMSGYIHSAGAVWGWLIVGMLYERHVHCAGRRWHTYALHLW